MNLFDATKEQKLYQQIASKIAQQIQQKEYLPGERLPSERALADQYSISRATVREAVIALEILGYVEIKMGAGIYVVNANPIQDINIENSTQHEVTPNELIDIRLLVEPEFAALAAKNASPKDIESFKSLQATAEKISDLNDHYYFDKKFHLLIAEATKNPLAKNIMQEIWQTAEQSVIPQNFNKHFVTKKFWDISLQEHKAVINAIIKGDEKLAEQTMYHHLVGVLLRLS
ncbi:FadR/GntR family transcriptional regulator [Ignatzschineria sp. LJL83]